MNGKMQNGEKGVQKVSVECRVGVMQKEKKSVSVHFSTGQIYNCIRINLWKVHIVWNDKRYIWKDRRQNDPIYFILSRMRNLKKE